MAVPKRKAEFLGLRDIDVFINDDSPSSLYFNVYEVPEILTQGKSSFLIGGSGDLKPGIDIKLELIKDDSDDIIYLQPVLGHSEGGLRRVSIEVYDDTPPGVYTLYIVGELNPNKVSVPSEWHNAYNVRWSKRITINVMGVNTQPILFYKQPNIRVSEQVKEFIISPSGSGTTVYLTGSGEPAPGFTTPEAPVQNFTEGGYGTYTYPNIDFTNKAKLGIIEENKPLVKLSGKVGHIGSQGKQVKTMSPVPNDYLISLGGDSTVNSLYVGQDFTLNNPQVDTSKFTMQDYYSLPAVYTSSVMKVINNKTFVPKDIFYVQDTRTTPATLIPAPFVSTYPITASYYDLPSQTTSSINFQSFADITVQDMKTFSGDVHKVKIFAKSEGSSADFEKIYDSPIESTQVLFDSQETTNQVNMGYFLDTPRVTNYWEIYQGSDGNTSGTLTYDATYVNDSMKISGSNQDYGHTLRVQNKTAVNFIAGTLYNFRAKIYGIKKNKKDIDGNISALSSFKVMAYGDAFNKEETTAAHWGDEKLSIPNMPDAVSEYDYGMVEGSFLADNTATGYIQFQVDSGEWYVSDIELKTATDTAFNPDYIKITTPVPPLAERPDDMRFLVEFYDVNNNIADSIIFSEPIEFQGPNINISGTNNILSGSMYIGNSIGGGVEMAGVNSAFIRSMGYRGFKSGSGYGNNAGDGDYSGFMFFSGSVLPDSGDDYKGVGLELVGNSGSYFKFRTNPSELDIRTDAFFIGQESIQFLSGSDGNIEISSSLFHLDPANDLLVIGADAVINADLTVNNLRTPATIGGSPSTELNASASISSVGYAAFRSASIGGFDVDSTTIASTDDSLILRSSGQITGSAVILGDKSAGQYLQFVDDTLTVQGDITANSIRTPATIGGSPSTDANASASISSTGLATFKSGSIAGWKIFGNKLSGSNATLDADGAALYHSSKGPGSDSPAGGFHQLRDEYYIDFTPSQGATATAGKYYVKFGPNFSVSESGVLFASGAVFEGQITASTGLIGGAAIESTSLSYAPYWRISSSADVEDPASFISSSKFKVSADGAVTGSNMLFDGGTIAGWNIASQIISSTDSTGGIKFDSYNKQIGIRSGSHVDSTIIEFGRIGGTVADPKFGLEGLDTTGNLLFRLGERGNEIAGWAISGSYISKAISGSAAYQEYTRVYMSSVNDNAKNITEGFSLYRKDEDIDDGAVKIVRLGGLTDTTDLHSNGDYGLQIIKQNTAGSYSNLLYIGSGSQTISGWNISATGFSNTGVELSSTQASMSLGTSGELLLKGGTNSPYISLQPAEALVDKTYAAAGVFLGVSGGSTPLFSAVGTGGHIKFNGTDLDISADTVHFSGSSVTIATPTFFMGATGSAFISGSNGNLVLSSSKFFVDQDGDVTGSSVNFTGGSIAGWDLSSTRIQSPGNTMRLTSTNPKITIGTHTVGNGPGIQLGYDSGGTLTFFAGESATDFIKYTAGTGIDIKTQKLEVDATNIEISSTNASMSLGEGKIDLVGGSTSYIQVGSANAITLKDDGTDRFLAIGSKTSFSHFDQSTAGVILGTDGGTTKFELAGSSTNYLSFDGSNFDIKLSEGLELDATNIEISSTNASMSLGEGKILLDGANSKVTVGSTSTKQITLQGHADYGYIATGKTSATSTTAGFWLANNDTDPEFHVGNATDYIKFDGGEIDLASRKLEVSASTIQVSTAESSMSFGHTAADPQGKIIIEGKGTPTFRMGPDADFISLATGSGIYMDGDGNFRFGDADGGIVFNNGSFAITGSDVDINVTDINIATTGFELSSQEASMSLGTGRELLLKGGNANPYVSIGQTTDSYGETGVFLGYVSSVSRPRVSYVGSAGHFKFDTGVDIDTTTFELDANNGDLQISSTQKSMSLNDQTIVLDGANAKITIGSANAITIQGGASDNFMTMGSKTSFTHYDKSTVGIILGMDSAVPKFEMAKSGDEYLRWDSTDGLDIRTKKMEVSASNLEISSTQASMSIGDPNSSGGAIVLHADGTDKMLKFGDKTTFDQTTTAGLIMGMDATNPEFDYTVGTGNNQFIRMTPSGISIKTPSFVLDTDRLDIDSDNSRIDVYDDSGGVDGSDLRVRIGEVDPTTGNHYGMVIYDGTGSGSADELVHFSDVRNQIASWSLSPTQITSENLILDSSGLIQTADFASGVQGWRITAANNGEAEFEKVTVRGTLATTVFEKESVNAVGGQLYVANSTIISQSAQLSTSATTMSVANVGGFVADEIISAKKVSDTGFMTEYMKIESASRDNPTSDKDFSGKLYVVRGYSGSLPGTNDTGSLGDAAQSSQTYENGQVIVSTGKVGTGYIRLNANPNDSTTPYIDIVERTGSAIYDVDLKARLGDLSGLSSGLLYGNTSPGFGLFTENVFLQGAITATTGSFTGIVWIETDVNNKMALGTNVQSTNDGIYLNDNNYWYTNDKFRIGDTNYYLKWDSSNIEIVPQKFELNAGSGDIQISSTQKSMSLGDGDILLHSPNSSISTMRLGSTTTKAIYMTGSSTVGAIRSGKTSVSDTTEGFWLANNNADAEFHVGDGTDYIKFDDNALTIETRTFELDANSGDLVLSSTHKSMSLGDGGIKLVHSASNQAYMQLGSTAGQGIEMTGSNYGGTIRSAKRNVSDTTAGFWLHNKAGTSEFHVGDSTEYIKFDGSDLSIASSHLDITASNIDMTTDEFHLDATDIEISSTEKSMSLGYNTSTAHGLTMVGGSTSQIGFGTKDSYRMKLVDNGTDSYLQIGTLAFGSETNAGVLIGSDAGNAELRLYKDSDEYFTYDQSSGFDLRTTSFVVDTTAAGGGFIISGTSGTGTSNFLKLGSATSVDAGEGFYVDGGGNFRIGTATTVASPSYMKFASSALSVRTSNLVIDTSKIDITTEHGGMIALGASSSSLADLSGTGIFLSGSGEFNFEYNSSNYFRRSGTTLSIATSTFDLATTNILLRSAQNSGMLSLGSTPNLDVSGSNAGIYMDGTGDFLAYGNSTNYLKKDGTSLDIKAGTFDLDATTVVIDSATNSGKLSLGASPNTTGSGTAKGVYMDGTGDFLAYTNATNYIRKGQNKLDIKADTFDLATSTMVMDSGVNSGKIALGNTPPTSVAYTSNAGVYMDGTGDFLVRGDADNFIKVYSNTLQLKTETFDLDAGSLIMDSAGDGGTGTFRLGGSGGPASPTDTTAGIYMDGGGALNVYGDSSNYLRIDGSTIDMRTTTFYLSGSDITLKSPDFYLGDTSNYISGSGGNLAIYSTGNTTLSGSSISLKTPDFYLGDATNYISGSGGAIKVAADTFDLNTTYLRITDTAVASALAEGIVISGASKHILVGSGIAIEGDGDSNAGSITIGSKVTLNGSSDSRISNFYIGSNDIWGGNSSIGHSATTIVLGNLDGTSKIALGATADSLSMTAGTGVYADGDGKFKAGTATGYGIFWDASTLRVSSSDFYLGDATNYISGSGGAIDVAADTFDLKTSNLRVSSSNDGIISMGATIPKSISGSGVFLRGTGDFLAGNHTGNKIQYASGPGAIVMKSNTFSLDASTIVIDSSANDGKIALGASPNSSVAGTNKGIYMDGQGDFLAYGDAKNYIKFDASATSIDMKSDTFGLGTATMVISSSVNNGTIRMGSNGGPIAHNTAAAGIYMDGQGRFQVYGDSDNYLRWDGSDLTVKGDLTVDSIKTPSTIGGSASTFKNASSSIDEQGLATFKSASIAGFDITEGAISSSTGNLLISSIHDNNRGAIRFGSSTTIPSSDDDAGSKGVFLGSTGIMLGEKDKKNLSWNYTTGKMEVSSSLMISGSMTIGTADSASAQPDSYMAVGKVSDPWTNTAGIEMRKDYFANFRLTYGILHQDKTAGGSFSTACNGSGSGTSDHLGGHSTVDNCSAAVMPDGAVGLSMIYVHGQCGTAFPILGGTAARFDAETTGENQMANIEIDEDEDNLIMRLVTWAEFTDDYTPTSHARSPDQNYVSISGCHTGLAPGDYIGIGKGFFTEIAYVTAVPDVGHNRELSHGELLDAFKKVPWYYDSSTHNKTDVSGYANPPETTSGTTTEYYQYLATTGYSVVTLVRDCFDRGIRYSNHYDTPGKNPEDYVEILNVSASADPENTGGSGGDNISYYIPLPALQPHGHSQWYSGGVVTRLNLRNWRDSGRKVVVFTSTPKPIPTMMVGKGGMIMAVDKDESNEIKAEVGWKIYSEFSTERASGQGSYESGLGLINPS